MKTLKTFFVAFFALTLFSCGNSRPVTTTNDGLNDTTGTIREVADHDDGARNNRSNQNSQSMKRSNDDMNSDRSATTNRTMDNNKDKMDNSTSMDRDANSTTAALRMMNEQESMNYWIVLKGKDQQSMYDALNMSKDQILKYQRGYADYMDKRQNENERLAIDQKDLMKQRDGILYDILKPAQYDKYKQWKMKSPNSGM